MVPSTAEATAATPVIRAQMGVYVIGLWHNLTGRGLPPAPPQLSATTPSPTERDVVVQESVGQAGGVVSGGGVTVTVPAGALSGEAVVAVREPLGRFGVEFGGPVVEIDHDQPLAEPVTVSWDVSDLTEYQQRSLLLVTWDEELADWIPGNVDYTIADGVLTARIQQWSWWSTVYNWIVSASQTVQEVLGRRVDAPKCAEGPLPYWVRKPHDPDDDFTASAIRLCYEHGGGDTLTMRLANNRTVSQYVHTDRYDGWEGYWLIDPGLSLVGIAQLAAHRAFSNGEDRLFVPPLKYLRADFSPSPTPGLWRRVQFSTSHDLETFLADLLFFALSRASVPNLGSSGVASKVQLYLEVLFECGSKQVADVALADSANSWLRTAVSGLVSCSKEVLDPESRFGGVLRDRLTKELGPKALTELRRNRNFSRIGRAIGKANWVTAFWEAAGYAADQILQAKVGDLTWGFTEVIVEGPDSGVEPYSLVSAGPYYTCAVQTDQTIVCWGAEDEDYDHGQTNPPDGAFTAVSAGRHHACGVRTSGAIACWGNNDNGQADPPRDTTFKGVTAGTDHTCGLHTDGAVTCWGSNTSGQTDTPDGVFIAVAAGDDLTCGLRIGGIAECWGDIWSPEKERSSNWTFKALSAGGHVCGLTTGGGLNCWDDPFNQARGTEDETFTAFSTEGTAGAGSSTVSTCGLRHDGSVKCWGVVEGEREGPFTAITVGASHMCATRPDGTILCAGRNRLGQTNTPDDIRTRQTRPIDDEPPPDTTPPQPIGATTISAGSWHSCGIRSDGTAVCWGSGGGYYGQDAPSGTFIAIAAGGIHSCGIRTDGTAVCWGSSRDGEDADDAPSGAFAGIAAGEAHSCGIRSDGTAVCWGDYGWPGQVAAPSGTFAAIAAGTAHSCGIRSDGAVVCWGWNEYGQVDAPSGAFAGIAAGGAHSCGIRSDGAVVCWGWNEYGQVDAPSGTFAAIAAGLRHSCGIRSDGAVVCWGWNEYGQVDAPSGAFAGIAAGEAHSCGIRTDGTAVCWGSEQHGRLNAPSGSFTQNQRQQRAFV